MSAFTQKHYEKLAAFYKYELDIAVQEQTETGFIHRVNTIRGLIRLHAFTLQNDNPKFNTQRFYRACGLGE